MSTATTSTPHRPTELPLRPTVDQFVAALAKAVHRFRAYPPDSPLCEEALEAALRALLATDREQIELRIVARAVLVDDQPVTETSVVGELRRQLHQAGVGGVRLLRVASIRDLAWLCREGVASNASAPPGGLSDSLESRGLQHVQVTMVVKPAVLGAEGVPADRLARVDLEERRRRSQRTGHGSQLYPPDKGWIRLDPGLPAPAQVSLTGLAELVGDPLALAGMLVSLTDQPPFDDPIDALADKFELVSDLFGSVDPALGGALFARLAKTVLELPEGRRHDMLRDTILPGLLEGRIDGLMLRHFPDPMLAETLSLVMAEQVGVRQLLNVALDRLELPVGRRTEIERLVAERADTMSAASRRAVIDELGAATITGYDGGRINVDLSTPKEFGEFGAVDLAIDETAEAAIAVARAAIHSTEYSIERLRCLVNLLSLEGNPETAGRLLAAAAPLLHALSNVTDRRGIAEWIQRLRRIAAAIRAKRPDIAALIDSSLARHIDGRLLEDVLGLGAADGERRGEPVQLLEAFGAAAAPALVDLLEHEAVRSRRHALVKLMCACAPALAPGLLPLFPHPQRFVTRNLATVFGHAGPGYEATLAAVITHSDVRVVREALRGLAQIGTPQAIDVVTRALGARDEVATIAEDVFWSFATARQAAVVLLQDPDFVGRHAGLARRLLVRAARADRADLQAVIGPLTRLRLHLWRPSHVWLGFTAARLARR
jgi:hypothetical protein